MTNTTAPLHAAPIAPLRATHCKLESTHYSYAPGVQNVALLQLQLGAKFDADGCPDCEGSILIEMPTGFASSSLVGVLFSQWVKANLPGWTYLANYNVTGARCPVGGYSDSDTPF